jgi:hypothetical protein
MDASGGPEGREGEGEAVGTGGLWRDLDGEDLEGGLVIGIERQGAGNGLALGGG